MATVTFDGMDLAYFFTFTDESEIFVTPEKDYEFIEVPGLNGRLTIDNHRFKDVTIPINCFIRENFEQNYHELLNFLYSRNGYKTLLLSQEQYHFRKALFYNAVKPDTGSFNKSGRFTLNFNCKPQRFLKSGAVATEYQSGATVGNPYFFDAKPLIRWFGNGTLYVQNRDADLNVTTYQIDVDNISPNMYIDIDCETMTCTGTDNINMSQYVTVQNNEYPVLKAENNITFNYTSDSDHTLQVTPRWWEV